MANHRIFLTTEEVVARWGGRPSVKTVANWRSLEPSPGPPFTKFGSRVFYLLDTLEQWESEHQFASIREYPARPTGEENLAAAAEAANLAEGAALVAAFDIKISEIREEYAKLVARLTASPSPVKRKPGRPKGSLDKGPRRSYATRKGARSDPDAFVRA